MPRINDSYEDRAWRTIEQQPHEDTAAAGEVGEKPDKHPTRTRSMEPRSAAIAIGRCETDRAPSRVAGRLLMASPLVLDSVV
jgi:hypothetical protein